ncbi:hypothetical protein TNCV_2357131 [Trichonephila clavipes]|nr:hypothetical protein TNCV_2357131 [Trichonephila clavipes]
MYGIYIKSWQHTYSKTSSAKQNSRWKVKRPTGIEADCNLDSPVSMITVRRHLHKQNIYDTAAIPKPLVTDVNAKRLQWCPLAKTDK